MDIQINYNKALCELESDIVIDNHSIFETNKDIELNQYIEVTLNDTTVNYIIHRNLFEGTNITDIDNQFENLPYMENNQKTYDYELSVLEVLFNDVYVEFDIGKDIDEYLFEMNCNESETFDIIYTEMEYEEHKETIEIKLIGNEIIIYTDD